jgi:hypothetical protein
MKTARLQYMILRAASLLAPGDQRAEWLDGWRSELWYIPRRSATRFCLGAFQDALWVRRNNLSLVNRTEIHLESPLSCLAFLAILAAAVSLIAVRMPGPQLGPRPTHLSARDLPAGSVGMLMLSAVALPAMRLAMGPGAARYPIPWPSRMRRGTFMALKIALMQPILFGGFVIALPILSIPVANLGFGAAFTLAFRWVLIDQQRRYPVCLRLLTDPIRIGSASHTFLEWYGAESTCSRGHGLLHISEMPASYSAKPGWLRLGDSWRSLFSDAAGVRQS